MLNQDMNNNGRWRWSDWWSTFNWEETRAGVDRESRARVILLGLAGAGKSTLFNRLRGWTISIPVTEPKPELQTLQVEDFGLFCLIDLPDDANVVPGFGVGLDPGWRYKVDPIVKTRKLKFKVR